MLFTPEDVLGDFAGLSLETARAIRVHRLVAAAEGTPARAVDALARLRRSVAT